jgi:putative DNA primase/helicase
VAAWSRWLLWDGSRWTFDCTLTAVNLARKVCREAAAECNKTKTANVIASAKTVMGVGRLAKADPHHAATTDQRDADVWLLNTPSGAIDLRTGKGRPHQHENYCTKITGVARDETCPITTWLAFLDRVMGGDTELISFLQRLSGYALTGSTREHALAFL